MTLIHDDDQAIDETDDQRLGAVVDTLFEEAERRERRRRALIALLAVLAAATGGIYVAAAAGRSAASSHHSGHPAPAIRPASYFGDPTSEMVIVTNTVDGVLIPIEESVQTTLASVPQTRARMLETAFLGSPNDGVDTLWVGRNRYVANGYRAQICTPQCVYTTKPWLQIEPAETPPWASGVQYDPARLLATIRKASQGTLRVVGHQRLDGTEMTAYRGSVTVQGERLIAKEPREGGLVDDLRPLSTEWSHPFPGEDPLTIAVSLWVDPHGLGRRIVFSWGELAQTTLSGPNVPTKISISRETHVRLVTLSHFGVPVSTKPPAASGILIVAPGQRCRVFTPLGGSGSC